MNKRAILLLSVLASMGVGTAGLVACSAAGSSSSSGDVPGLDSGGGTDSTAPAKDSGGTPGTDSAAPSDDGGGSSDANSAGDCKMPPAIPFPEDGGTGPYCPFVAGDAGKHCPRGETCCHDNNTAPETCAASASACAVPDGGLTYGCDTPLMCGSGQVCCTNGSILTDQTCGYLYASKSSYTVCRASCQGGELPICAQQSDCAGGAVCTSFKGKGGHDLGYCK